MHPVIGSTRPCDNGAKRCGHASIITDHSEVIGLFHATSFSPATSMEIGRSTPLHPDLASIGNQDPPTGAIFVSRRELDILKVDLKLPRDLIADAVQIQELMHRRLDIHILGIWQL